MICTEQERAALMALVARFGNSMSGETREDPDDLYAAIRAMLAPPDDAVVIPRALAERAVTAFCVEAKYHAEDDMVNQSHAATDDAEALRAVLRGEATRDE